MEPIVLATCLLNLGIALLHRFERYGGEGDIEEAILRQSAAVDIFQHLAAVGDIPAHHSSLFQSVSNVGAAFVRRFVRYSLQKDIDEAIQLQDNAVKLARQHRYLSWRDNT